MAKYSNYEKTDKLCLPVGGKRKPRRAKAGYNDKPRNLVQLRTVRCPVAALLIA